ncbi:MAG: gamma-glutamyl-gamma-aminobutyrate hydrolase family protein [Rhodospirillales bacterium]|nr:gamma-glutamyl-gamma-aminobutyrate hydrolase family protein [Rhodospirillales bacterium]
MTDKTDTPLIGITMDSEEAGGYSKFPWYALRENYCGSVVAAGGMPLPLAHEPELANQYLDRISGLVITGGAFDVDPSLFGDGERHETVVTKDRRTEFELAVTRGALERDMPLLGICGGQQLLHVVLGGKLIQHVPDEIANCLAHEQPNPRDEVGHEVTVKEGSLLASITGNLIFGVNSAHHQAAKDEPKGVVVTARASDGVIEAIEAPAYTFCLGVQWHPEFFITPADEKIMHAFIAAARNYNS